MKRVALLVLASLIGSAPQMPTQPLSADGSCPLPAQMVKPGPATRAMGAADTAAARDCAQCEHHYHMPTRWHRLLPGMYR